MGYERSDVYPAEHRKMETSRMNGEKGSLSPDELADAYGAYGRFMAQTHSRFPHHYLSEQSCSALHKSAFIEHEKMVKNYHPLDLSALRPCNDAARRELVASFIIFVVSALIEW